MRFEDRKILVQGGRYMADLVGTSPVKPLRAAFVRADVAHGTLAEIDTSKARAIPGVVAVVTARELNLAPMPPIREFFNPAMGRPLLADDKVRYFGEAVAVTVAVDQRTAEQAAGQVKANIKALPALVDVNEARAGSQLLFESPDNIAWRIEPQSPEATDYFAECDVVVDHVVRNQRVHPLPLETHGVLANWAGGTLSVWLSTQTPHKARKVIARCLGLPGESVLVRTPDVGGAFGSKALTEPETVIVCWLAREIGAPVAWLQSRQDSMTSMGHGRAQVQRIRIGGRADGSVECYRLEAVQDVGAYPRWGAFQPALTKLIAPGPYDIKADRFEFESVSVVTSTTPVTSYRGTGRVEAVVAMERSIDRFAKTVGLDPAVVRRMNLIRPTQQPFTNAAGAVYDGGDYVGALDAVLAKAGYEALRCEQEIRRAKSDTVQLGIGLCCYVDSSADEEESETVRVEIAPDDTVNIYTALMPHGQGMVTAFRRIAADTLNMSEDNINIIIGDTGLVPPGSGTFASRSLQTGGSALKIALQKVAKRLADEPKEKSGGRRQTRGRIVEEGYFRSVATSPYGVHLAVVEVDTQTGAVRLARYVALDDVGKVYNPDLVAGQRQGGIVQGIGQCLSEQMSYNAEGIPDFRDVRSYGALRASDLPDIELLTVETPSEANMLGAKGAGECGAVGAPAAVLNAVVDAVSHLGVCSIDMPCTPWRVWQAIQSAHEVGE